MNDPKNQPIEIEEQRAWLKEHKQATGLSWKQLQGRTGVNHTTLGLFTGANYAGDNAKIAEAVFRYRQTLAAQAALKADLPEAPGFFETETSRRLVELLSWAQRGRINAAALSPGLGKTMTAEHYKACNTNVFMFTADAVTSGIVGMQKAVLRALSVDGFVGQPHAASARIRGILRDRDRPLLIVDEAHELGERSIDQIRSWYDEKKSNGEPLLGVALLGNAGLIQTLEGGGRLSRAQLFSRVFLKFVQTHPFAADIDAMLEAWGIRDEEVCRFVHAIARRPGGLRGASFAIELAHVYATAAREELAVRHLQDAWAQRSAGTVAA